ncbi:MAG: GDP-mannose 4,6-dehydratase [Verrucomicrobiota bacterium]|nr:GDP-mannose 4,6-dehydratase [Verrucomicrobiota bacterium]
MRSAIVTGITGQDGSYLAELLLEKNYHVHGTLRPGADATKSWIAHLLSNPALQRRIVLHQIRLTDSKPVKDLIADVAPDEIYHLAGQSHVGLSYEIPEETCEFAVLSALRLLESLRSQCPHARFFSASSAAIFGRPTVAPQDEQTPIAPVNPYGCAKAFATHLVRAYRESYGLFACSGILYNHESPRRGPDFVTRKICRAAAAIKAGLQHELLLGDLEAKRDWGHARDFVNAMWLMLQQANPDDYVVATGVSHSVIDVLDATFGSLGLQWRTYVRQDPALVRPREPVALLGNSHKALVNLGWKPTVTFEEMIREMTFAEVERLRETCG